MFTTAQLRAEREQLLARARTLLDDVTAAGRDLTEDEDVEYTACVDRATQIGPMLERAERVEQIAQVARSSAGNLERGSVGAPEFMKRVDPFTDLETVRRGGVSDTDVKTRAMAAIERAPSHLNDAGRQHATRLIERDSPQSPLIARHMLLTGSPEYHEEFQEYARTRGAYIGPLMRAAMSTTGANGGFLVPYTLDPTVILTNAGVVDPIRSISRNVQIATTTFQGVTSAGVTAEWTGENTEWADASPGFAQISITPKKADAWIQGSYEILADSGFASELGRLLADAKARLEATAFAIGNTGATQPRGVVAAVAAVTSSIVTAFTTNAFAKGDVYSLSGALRPRDAEQASWIGNKNIFNLIRQFDTAGGGSFWANLGMGTPSQLLDNPIYQCSAMASAITTGANVLLAGNFQEFYVVDRVGMSVLYEPMIRGVTNGRPVGEAGWAAFWRVSSDVADPGAFRLLQLSTVAAATALA